MIEPKPNNTRRLQETSVTRVVTALTADLLPQESTPRLIWIIFTMESSRNKHPITDPTPDPSIPNLRIRLLI